MISSSQHGRRVAFVISDHGLGHAARSCTVISSLIDRNAEVLVVTKVPKTFLSESIGFAREGKWALLEFKADVGVFQKTSVIIDVDKTLGEVQGLWNDMPNRVKTLASYLKDWRAEIVVFDIGATAPLVASELNLPSVGISNFAWDWIYSAYVKEKPEFQEYIDLHRDAYQKTTLFLQLPFVAHELAGFHDVRTAQVSLMARKASLSRHDALEKLGLEPASSLRYLLFSFGGHEFPIETFFAKWKIPEHWRVVWIEQNSQKNFPEKFERIITLKNIDLPPRGVRYVDLLAAMDCCVLKTGYGIVGEVIANGVPAIYSERPGFLEHDYLVRGLQQYVPCAQASFDEIYALDERIFRKAEELVSKKHAPNVKANGSEEAADYILKSIDPSTINDTNYARFQSSLGYGK